VPHARYLPLILNKATPHLAHFDREQHTHCSTLQHFLSQHVATQCITPQKCQAHHTCHRVMSHTARFDREKHTATHRITMQHAVTHCNAPPHAATHYNCATHTIHATEGDVIHSSPLPRATRCNAQQHAATLSFSTRRNTLQQCHIHDICNRFSTRRL